MRTLQLDLTQERLRSTEIAKAQATASGNQTPLPPQVFEMFEKQMENSNAMMREAREESRVHIETLKVRLCEGGTDTARCSEEKEQCSPIET